MIAYTIIFISIPVLVAPSGDSLFRSALLRTILTVCVIGLLFGAATYIDKRPIRSFGLEIDGRWGVDALVGLIIGGAIPTVATVLGLVGGWMTVSGVEYTPTATYLRDLGFAIVITVGIAIVEELVFRGYVLSNAIEGLNFRWLSQPVRVGTALGLSALLFALTHPAPELVNGLHFLCAGLLLGLAYLCSGQLALPIGIHAGFNFVSAYVFPTAADPSVAVLSLTVHGPSWLTGQTGFIPLVLQFPAALAIIGYIWWQTGDFGISPTVKSRNLEG
ncbi:MULTISPECIES: CPBP family intramembrane glutamic endopeptidase [Halobacteriales]|uniref:CPBP family intramembrane metalloprotease n=3 Tax=Halobacteriales TaxID=2235 RepID=A0A8U0I2B1_9EURY|nr:MULTISPECIES: CPBP family intramembrane glutamic endopeptidase [Halobacteriales]UPV77056.1 CPBP family intramembrane metalloprotease [Halorussus limi]USZ78451.1 CPBP family intramembrane metalloprotease [Halorussus vallis]